MIVASVMSAFVTIAVGAVNQIGDGLGAEAHEGGRVLAMLWSSSVLMGISVAAWFWQWHTATFESRRGEKEVAGGGPVVEVSSHQPLT